MLHSLSGWFWNPSDRRGFCLGTCLLAGLVLSLYSLGVQASLTVGPGGDLPGLSDVLLYAFSHDEPWALLLSLAGLLCAGPRQERLWGTVPFVALGALTAAALPLLYTLLLFVGGGEATRICGHSAVQLSLLTAQCRHAARRRPRRWPPVWGLPWLLLLMGGLLLPGTPVLLHFCSICIGHNYYTSFIQTLQELEEVIPLHLLPHWAYVPSSSRVRLPTYVNPHSSSSLADQAAASSARDASIANPNASGTASAWMMDASSDLSETQLLEEQLLRAGILASLRDAPDNVDVKVEVPKSSVSSLRLQQLEKMGFSTEKAVVALAASKQLDGAISLLVDDSVGGHAVVVSKGKSPPSS